MTNRNSKGSIWRIWDLHVHSPKTYGGDYSTFITNVSQSKASVVGINDYCSIEGYKSLMDLGGVPDKALFPVVEFRMHNIVANRKNADPTKSGTKINFHIIFDNNPTVFNSISNWLNSLECYNERGETIQLGVASDLMKLTFDFETVSTSLKKLSLYHDHSLIWLPYDEYGGIDDIDPNDNFFKLSLINKAHLIGSSTKKQIDFFKWQDPKYTKEQYKTWFDVPKPCIKGSDAHKIDYPFGHLQNQSSQPIDKFCWINAEPTFKGLKQIVVEPDRVFIGDEPDLLKRVRTNQTKFIRTLSITKTSDSTVDDLWFDNFKINLNSSLVAIIGNKGGGKSAITDILALCGNTHQDTNNFSFLASKKFRKQKPFNLSEKFQATLTWEDGTTITRKLNENPNTNLPERVKYIPQNFLERLCANIESDEFERELKQIIFSHTPSEKRLGKSSLDELINYRSSLVIDEIAQIRNEVSKLNVEIVQLENMASQDFKKTIENKLQLKKDELTAHFSIKHQQPAASEQDTTSKALVEKLSVIREPIKSIEAEIAQERIRRTNLSIKLEELNRSLQFYSNLNDQLKKTKDQTNEFFSTLKKHGIDPDTVFAFQINTSPISLEIEKAKSETVEIDKSLDATVEESKLFKLKSWNAELQQGQEELDKPAKEQQRHLDILKEWETQKNQIEGSADDEGSLKILENQLEYLNTNLLPELASENNERKVLVEQLFDKKASLIQIRKELFQPVTQFINDFKDLKERYDVNLDVALELRSFAENFFSFVNQGRIGTFSGKDEGSKKLQDLIEKSHFDTVEGFVSFSEELVSNLKNDKRTSESSPIDINNQLRKGTSLNELYDFIYHYEYLQPIYNLKLGNKTLEELSPGERGALLLIFYLLLDNDDIPLIIDQPEENLDNESVYHILVHFIKRVKEKRQIVIVTHNPNLAIVCDADQIIHMQIEKENKNNVKFYAGAIEEDTINKAAVNILEGTLPAFNNRDSKYIR